MSDIIINGLRRRYGDKDVLRDFSLTLPEGRVTCLMAPSGAGKTTLLRLLAGLEAPDAGTVTGLEGLRLGVVFQEDRLLNWLDAVENIRLTAPERSRDNIIEELRRFGLGGVEGQPVGQLSGGMRRRVALLRALLAPVDVLLLDEPFNGLDEATRAAVAEEATRLINGRTTLFITHNPEEAALLSAITIRLNDFKEVCT